MVSARFIVPALSISAFLTAVAEDAAKVDFNKQVKPILEAACVHCHGPDKDKGDVRVDTKDAAFKGNEDAVGITAGSNMLVCQPCPCSCLWAAVLEESTGIVDFDYIDFFDKQVHDLATKPFAHGLERVGYVN